MRKFVRLHIEKVYLVEALRSSRLEVLEKAVLDLDQWLQGFLHDYPQVDLPCSEVTWPTATNYADFLMMFMIGINIGFF